MMHSEATHSKDIYPFDVYLDSRCVRTQ